MMRSNRETLINIEYGLIRHFPLQHIKEYGLLIPEKEFSECAEAFDKFPTASLDYSENRDDKYAELRYMQDESSKTLFISKEQIDQMYACYTSLLTIYEEFGSVNWDDEDHLADGSSGVDLFYNRCKAIAAKIKATDKPFFIHAVEAPVEFLLRLALKEQKAESNWLIKGNNSNGLDILIAKPGKETIKLTVLLVRMPHGIGVIFPPCDAKLKADLLSNEAIKKALQSDKVRQEIIQAIQHNFPNDPLLSRENLVLADESTVCKELCVEYHNTQSAEAVFNVMFQGINKGHSYQNSSLDLSEMIRDFLCDAGDTSVRDVKKLQADFVNTPAVKQRIDEVATNTGVDAVLATAHLAHNFFSRVDKKSSQLSRDTPMNSMASEAKSTIEESELLIKNALY